ncbi:hypothetical protein B0H14DRAFT_522764 [Mycena olivaceomarginata]|nr:hypothetical protein B0H14DRAFT_522764 [Mycena olivaceomarginata]
MKQFQLHTFRIHPWFRSDHGNYGQTLVFILTLAQILAQTDLLSSAGSFAAAGLPRNHVTILLSSWIELGNETRNALQTSWLSQANFCIGETVPARSSIYRCGVISKLACAVVIDGDYHHLLREEGTLRQAHIFLQPIIVKHEGPRIGLDFPESGQWYWSLDPTGSTRITPEECDSIGLPRLKFLFLLGARYWHKYQYNAIREFFEAKGFDPHNQDVTRLLGLPLAEMEPKIPPLPGQDNKANL